MKGVHMPYKTKKPCAFPRCPATVPAGTKYCETHRHLLNDEKQGNNRQRRKLYDTSRWRKLRNLKINSDPLCEECLRNDRITGAEEIDHIQPHKGNSDLFFDYKNLQSLCKSCHSSKTMRERNKKRGDNE